jgi:type VII secretion-associated serine protease mycosin
MLTRAVLGAVLGIAVLGLGLASALPDAAQAAGAEPGLAQQARSLELPELNTIDAPAAWRVSRGAGVTVAVLDTGVDGTVPDLTGSVTEGPNLIAGIDPAGYQLPLMHGTLIASLIAGHGSGPGDTAGIVGVAPQARVLSVRVIPDDGEPGMNVFEGSPAYTDALADGIRYAVQHGAQVINMSLGGPSESHDTRAALGYAIAHRVVIVAAAGNSGTSGGGYTPYSYPAAYPGVIGVAAVNADAQRASFSDRNASVVISAPGEHVIGAGPDDQYLVGDGTSPAAAFVSGVAALIKSRYPALSPALVEQALVTSAAHRPPGGYSPAVGAGEVDATAALAAAARIAATPADHGLAASASFAAQPGPVQVVRRDAPEVAGLAAAGALSLLLGLFLAVSSVRKFHHK